MIPLLNGLVKHESGNQESGIRDSRGKTRGTADDRPAGAGLGRRTNKFLRPSEFQLLWDEQTSERSGRPSDILQKGGGDPVHDGIDCKPQ